MLPILTTAQIRSADAHTIAALEGGSIALMEQAAKGCMEKILHLHRTGHFGPVEDVAYVVFVGMGNNGGDGLAIARLLHAAGHPVRVLRTVTGSEPSPDHAINYQRALDCQIPCDDMEEAALEVVIGKHEVVLDALFGTGLDRPVNGWLAAIIRSINSSGRPVVAIDIPSGLFCEDNSENIAEHIVRASLTLTFEVPKLAFLLAENAPYVGDWVLVDIGLDKAFLRSLPTDRWMLEGADAQAMLMPRPRFAHKGTFGHALLLAGAHGRMGAAILATRAALRSGAGLVTAHVPACGLDLLQSTCPEAMCTTDPCSTRLSELPTLGSFSAVGMGPGIGQHVDTARVLKLLIQSVSVPVVLDADALNVLAGEPTWAAFLPANCILTPHPREFDRLHGTPAKSAFERLQNAQERAAKWNCVVVLKGAWTASCMPDGKVFFNSTGGPGMAKGGSGDVLTGLLTGLLAQGLSAAHAALLGVHLHGLAGDIAADHIGADGMTANDITTALPEAWKYLRNASEEALG